MMMTFWQSIGTCFLKYADFTGRAQRSEFWWFALFQALLGALASALDVVIYEITDWGPLYVIVTIILLLPSLAVVVRRLHDVDKSGWWLLGAWIALLGLFLLLAENIFWVVGLASFIFLIAYFIWLATRGTRGDNRFGPDPLSSS